jgi:hypothetical protein
MTFSFTPVFLRSLLSQERHFLSTAGDYRLVGSAIFDPRERTVSRLLRRLRQPPSQTWKTFLHNHIGQMVSTDFFTVPPITMKVLFVFLVLEQDRRKVLHFNVTEHPTGARWT